MTYLLWLMKSSLAVHAAPAFTHNILAKHTESTASTVTGHWHIANRTAVMASRGGHRALARASFTWLAAGLSGSDTSAAPAATSTGGARGRAQGWVQVTPCAADHCGSERKIPLKFHTFYVSIARKMNKTLIRICYVLIQQFCLYLIIIYTRILQGFETLESKLLKD